MWRIRTFGSVALVGDQGSSMDRFDTQRAAKLLVLLGLSRNGRMDRASVADLLWPDDFPEATRLRLRQELSRLRKGMGPAAEALASDVQFVTLDQSLVVCDLELLRRALSIDPSAPRRKATLQEALRETKGEFLPGWHEDWVFGERQVADKLKLQATMALSEIHLEEKDGKAALDLLDEVRLQHPCEEGLTMLAMRAHTLLGSLTSALAEFQRLKRALQDSENREPGFTPQQAMEEEAPRPAPQNLGQVEWRRPPIPVDGFFGRTEELAELTRLVADAKNRLVTVLAPGGMGKTRLVLEWLQRNEGPRSLFVPLAECQAVGEIWVGILDSMGLKPSDQVDRLEFIARSIADQPAIVVLDNLEHLQPEANDAVREILQRCPGLQVIVTTRLALNLQGEVRLPLPPMPSEQGGIEMLESLVNSQRSLGQKSAPSREDLLPLVQFLGGVPLALKLAAPRLRFLSSESLQKELRENLGLLATDSADLPDRHRSLDQLLSDTLAELSEPERVFLQRLSVLRSGCTLSQAQMLCPGGDVLTILESLSDRSLIVVDDQADELHLTVLELIRAKALSSGPEPGEAAQKAAASTMVEWSESLSPSLFSPLSVAAIHGLDRQHDNCTIAFNFLIQYDPADALRLARRLLRYDGLRGRYRDVLHRYEALGETLQSAPVDVRADLAHGLGSCLARLGRTAEAIEAFSESSRLYLEAGNEGAGAAMASWIVYLEARGVAPKTTYEHAVDAIQRAASFDNPHHSTVVCMMMASALEFMPEKGDVGPWYELAYRYSVAAGDPAAMAHSGLVHCFHLRNAGRFEEARTILEELEPLVLQINGPSQVAFLHEVIGRNLLVFGDPVAAEARFRESLRVWTAFGIGYQMADQNLNIARALFDQGRLDAVGEYLLKSARLWHRDQNWSGLGQTITSVARLLHETGESEKAREVLGFLEAFKRHPDVILVSGEESYRLEVSERVGGAIPERAEVPSPDQALALFEEILGR